MVSDKAKGFQNLYPLYNQTSGPCLTEPWLVPSWLDHYSIDYNTVDLDHATEESWYPVAVNFWDFRYDYLMALGHRVLEKLNKSSMRLLFYYRESDDPSLILGHIDHLCSLHNIDPTRILLVSSCITRDKIPRHVPFWHFDFSYFFQSRHTPIPYPNDKKTARITCLSRTKKNWREWFVFNIHRYADDRDYLSYGDCNNIDGREDFIMWSEHNKGLALPVHVDLIEPTQIWRNNLPLTCDNLSSDQHNDHSTLVPEHFQNSYWNVVLETLLETEYNGGVMITEKTLKPIRNGQSFIVLGCAGTLEMLHEHGYQTFDDAVDESYDRTTDVRLRWFQIYDLTKKLLRLSPESLDELYQRCLPSIIHNQAHFQRTRRPELIKLMDTLCRQ